jgi:hypothetical protein
MPLFSGESLGEFLGIELFECALGILVWSCHAANLLFFLSAHIPTPSNETLQAICPTLILVGGKRKALLGVGGRGLDETEAENRGLSATGNKIAAFGGLASSV